MAKSDPDIPISCPFTLFEAIEAQMCPKTTLSLGVPELSQGNEVDLEYDWSKLLNIFQFQGWFKLLSFILDFRFMKNDKCSIPFGVLDCGF